MQFPWRPCRARLPRPVPQFYRFSRPLPAFQEDLEAASRKGPPCPAPAVRGPCLESVSYAPPPLDSRRQRHPHRETDAAPFRSSSLAAVRQEWSLKARSLGRETSTDTRPGYLELLQMEAGSTSRPAQ